MGTELESQDIEYVEYLEDDDDVNISTDQVEYVEAEQVGIGGEVQYDGEGVPVLEGHTIFEHNGRQYMIPDELHRSGQTIVLEDLGGDELSVVDGQWVLPEDSESLDASQLACTYMEVEEGKQFAVLRDGRLHIQGQTEPGVERKLQALEQSLLGDEEQTEQPEVTGRNLITGQTISLNGFLEKLRKKTAVKIESNVETNETVSFYSPEIERQRKTYYNHGRGGKSTTPGRPNYVLMPPVNRHVLVGKTPEGKNIVGKILQVWKKVDPETSKTVRTPRKRVTPRRPVKLLAETEQSPPSTDDSLDDNVTRTLSGLMELESVRQSLARRRLAVRHILKRSVGGRVLPGVRSIAHYYGTMHPAPTPPSGLFLPATHRWRFVPDPTSTQTSNDIDLKDTSDPQQLDTTKNDSFGTITESEETVECEEQKPLAEPLPVNLIVIEDESGRRRTKVTIPQLGVRCSSCNKSLRNEQLLRKHELQYHSGDVYSCDVCNRSFSSSGALRRHMNAHEELWSDNGDVSRKSFESQKRYRCRVCGKQFNRHSNMLRHAEIHRAPNQQPTGEEKSKPAYSCDLCGCQYNFVSSLTRHIVNNHLKSQPNETTTTATS